MLNREAVSENKSWNTPPKFIKLILEFFGTIDLDPCSNEYSLVNVKRKVLLPENGLEIDWDYDTIFINPPYGRDLERKTTIYDWIEKAQISNEKFGSEILMLIPVSVNTSHFKEIIFKKAKGICFLNDTRLKFYREGIEDKKGAPMACCMVYFGKDYGKFVEVFGDSGKCFLI